MAGKLVRVRGKVTSRAGEPIGPATISVYPGGRQDLVLGQTDAQGNFDWTFEFPFEASHVCLTAEWVGAGQRFGTPNLPSQLREASGCAAIRQAPGGSTSGTLLGTVDNPAGIALFEAVFDFAGNDPDAHPITHDFTAQEASSYALCPPGQVNVNGVCRIGCPGGQFYDETLDSNGQPRGCVAECAANEYYDPSAPGPNRCVRACAPGSYWNGSTCLQGCPPGKWWNGATCVTGCPEGEILTHRGCEPGCRQGQFYDGFRCRDQCREHEFYDAQTQQCVAGCDPGNFLLNGQCIPACGPGKARFTPSGPCESVCAENEFWNGAACQKGCPPGYFFEDGQCVEACDEKSYRLIPGGPCIQKCNAGEIRDADGRCIPLSQGSVLVAIGVTAVVVAGLTYAVFGTRGSTP